jgi:hypothetical protein
VIVINGIVVRTLPKEVIINAVTTPDAILGIIAVPLPPPPLTTICVLTSTY